MFEFALGLGVGVDEVFIDCNSSLCLPSGEEVPTWFCDCPVGAGGPGTSPLVFLSSFGFEEGLDFW